MLDLNREKDIIIEMVGANDTHFLFEGNMTMATVNKLQDIASDIGISQDAKINKAYFDKVIASGKKMLKYLMGDDYKEFATFIEHNKENEINIVTFAYEKVNEVMKELKEGF